MISQRIILIITLSLTGVGCSSFMDSTHKYLFGDDSKKAKEQKPPTREEYNTLLAKYKNLDEKYKKISSQTALDSDLSDFSQVDELANAKPVAQAPDTVDAFAQDIMNTSPVAAVPTVAPLTEDEVSQEIKYYKKGVALKMNGNIDSSLKVFQYLERSKTSQVRVRAKSHIAQIYMKKNQYDLALQVNEDIIKTEGFSGKVLSALQDSVICAKNLKLESKKLQYQSMLTDFFNIRI